MQDRNFDDIAEKEFCNIYGTTKRATAASHSVADLGSRAGGDWRAKKLRVLDAGGGVKGNGD